MIGGENRAVSFPNLIVCLSLRQLGLKHGEEENNQCRRDGYQPPYQ